MDQLIATIFSQAATFPFESLAAAAGGFIETIRPIFQAISIVLFLALVVLIYKMSKIRSNVRPLEHFAETLRAAPVSTNRLARQWGRIKERLERPNEAEWKISVIEADNLADDLLRRMGYHGTSMGERLKSITSAQLTSLDAIWAGHKVRNRIVHDPDARLLHREAREAIANFEAFLKEAQVIE